MKKPIYSCCDILRAKISQLKTILCNQPPTKHTKLLSHSLLLPFSPASVDDKGNLTKKGSDALQQYIMGVIVAGVNGGINVYLDTFLSGEYYRENPQDKNILDNMCVLLEEEREILGRGLDVYKRGGSEKFYEKVKVVYDALAANIDKTVKAHRNCDKDEGKDGSKDPRALSRRPAVPGTPCLVFPLQSMNASLRMSVAKPRHEQRGMVPLKMEEGARAGAGAGAEEKKPEFDEERLMDNISELSATMTRRIQEPPSSMLFSNRAMKTRLSPLKKHAVTLNFTGETEHTIPGSEVKKAVAPKPAAPSRLVPQTAVKNQLARTVYTKEGTPLKISSGTTMALKKKLALPGTLEVGYVEKTITVRHPEVTKLDQTPLRSHQRMKSANLVKPPKAGLGQICSSSIFREEDKDETVN